MEAVEKIHEVEVRGHDVGAGLACLSSILMLTYLLAPCSSFPFHGVGVVGGY